MLQLLTTKGKNFVNCVDHNGKRVFKHYYSTSSEQIIPSITLLKRGTDPTRHNKVGIISQSPTQNLKFTYGDLTRDSEEIANQLFKITNLPRDIKDTRIALLCNAGYDYVRTQWGVWRAGGIFVPLCTTHPPAELEYVLHDSEATVAICDKAHQHILAPLCEKNKIQCITLDPLQLKSQRASPPKPVKTVDFDVNRGAMIVYTSGTTGKPKGVVSTHANIEAQVLSMIQPWGWTEKDHILHVLPLHHVHGIVNVLACPLWAGALCEMMEKFDSKAVWQRFVKGDGLTLFMAVPTIYGTHQDRSLTGYVARLIQEYEHMSPAEQREATEACKRLRLMVSGSAALPESIMKRWEQISGHILLERYGMTEIGMALSNPLHGARLPGTVGFPLPGVTVRIVDEKTGREVDTTKGEAGELRVKGPAVFKEYWKKPKATSETFDEEGWFKTGDVATVLNGYYKILGRASVDIIKSGGYKISALDIERELLEHPDISECAVVGVEDEEWGQKIVAIVVQKKNTKPLQLEDLRVWSKSRLANYKVPKMLITMEAIPKNAMGKINKKELIKLVVKK